jgi:hypothetical protein
MLKEEKNMKTMKNFAKRQLKIVQILRKRRRQNEMK